MLEMLYTALVSPFLKDGTLDRQGFVCLVRRLYRQGLRGFLVGGTTGEGPNLSIEEKIWMAKTLHQQFEDVSVMMGVGSNHTGHTLEEIMQLNEIEGIDAYLCVTPYYIKPSQNGLYAHFLACDAISCRPIILYNVPARTGVRLSVELIERLLENTERIVGLKQCGRDEQLIFKLKKTHPDFVIYSGDDHRLLQDLYLGADGAISVVSQLIGPEVLRLLNDFKTGQNLEPLDDYIKMIAKYCFMEASPAPTKYLLSRLGLIENVLRLPLVPVSEETAACLDQIKLE